LLFLKEKNIVSEKAKITESQNKEESEEIPGI
jgi:hypothetical protein